MPLEDIDKARTRYAIDCRIIFFAVVVLAFVIRLAYFARTANYIQPPVGSDAHFYLQWAERIVRGDITAGDIFYAMPGYPNALALIYLFSRGEIFFILLTHIFIGSINCGLIYILGKKCFGNQAGIFASIIACGYFMLIFYDRMFLPATLSIFAGLLFALSLLKVIENPTPKAWFGAGLLLGVAALFAASFFLLALFVFVWLGRECGKRPQRMHFAHYSIFILAFSLVVGCIALMSYVTSKETGFIPAHSGINFYIGNNPASAGIFKAPAHMRATQRGLVEDAHLFAEKMSERRLSAAEASRFWFKNAADFIRSQPISYLKLTGRKFFLFLNGREFVDEMEYFIYNEGAGMTRFPFFRFSLLCPLAITGIFFLRSRESKIIPLYLFIFSFIFSTTLFFVNSRYRVGAVPYLAIFAGAGLWQIFQKFKKRQPVNLFCSLAVFLGLYLLCNVEVAKTDLRQRNFGIRYAKAVIFMDAADYQNARREFETAAELNPDSFLSYLGLGNAYHQLGQSEQAISSYKKALAANPSFYTGHFNLGIIYAEIGKTGEAAEEFKRVIEIQPRYAPAHYNLGRIYHRQGLEEQALREYEKALEAAPGHRQILQAIDDIKNQ